MTRTLNQAGYLVSESSNELQLEAGLKVQPFLGAKNALLVLSAALASRCARPLSLATRERVRSGLRPARLILTCEFGAFLELKRPELAACISVGVLEKPFELHDLRALALESLHSSKVSGVQGV